MSILKIVFLLLLGLLLIKYFYFLESFTDTEKTNEELLKIIQEKQKTIDRLEENSSQIDASSKDLLKKTDIKLKELLEKAELDKKQIRFCEKRDSLDNFMLHHKNRERAISKLNSNFKDLIEDSSNLEDFDKAGLDQLWQLPSTGLFT